MAQAEGAALASAESACTRKLLVREEPCRAALRCRLPCIGRRQRVLEQKRAVPKLMHHFDVDYAGQSVANDLHPDHFHIVTPAHPIEGDRSRRALALPGGEARARTQTRRRPMAATHFLRSRLAAPAVLRPAGPAIRSKSQYLTMPASIREPPCRPSPTLHHFPRVLRRQGSSRAAPARDLRRLAPCSSWRAFELSDVEDPPRRFRTKHRAPANGVSSPRWDQTWKSV